MDCHVSIRTDDVDRARDAVADHFYGTRLDVLRPSSPLAAALDVLPGAGITVGDIRFGADVRMRFGELGAYHVDVPITGRLAWRQAHTGPRTATPTSAAVFQPHGETVLDRWESGCRLIAIKIDRRYLERTLARAAGVEVRGPLRFDPVINIATGPGRTFAALGRLLAAEARNPSGLAGHRLLGPRLREDVATAFLLAGRHQYTERLVDPAPARPAPSAIRRAVAAIHDAPEKAYTLTDLARTARVSARTLQVGFRSAFGVTPMGYLRDVRLARAHADLRAAAPGSASVAEVGARWGFPHPGRFAARYRARFGHHPSETLRGS